MAKSYVQIENPPEGFRDQTSYERARRFCRQERADFVAPGVIRFRDTPIQALVVKSAEQTQHERLMRLTGRPYDSVEGTFFDAARHIPVVNADKMIREERSSRKWSFTASVFLGGHRRPFAGSTARVHSPSASQS